MEMKGKLNATSVLVSTYTKNKLREFEEYPRESFNNIILRLIRRIEKDDRNKEIIDVNQEKIVKRKQQARKREKRDIEESELNQLENEFKGIKTLDRS